MHINARPDWLSVTGKSQPFVVGSMPIGLGTAKEIAAWLIMDLMGERPRFKLAMPTPFYAYTFEDENTGIKVSIPQDMQAQGWLMVLTGKTFRDHPAAKGAIPWALDNGRNITRMDFALDLFDSGIKPMDVADQQRAATAETDARQISFIQGRTGDTVYIGSRKSMKMLRIYDKGKQQAVSLDWKRIEIECKREAAKALAQAWVKDSDQIFATMRDMIADETSALHTTLNQLANGAEAFTTRIEKERKRRGVWLRSQVIRAIDTYSKEDLDDLADWWNDVWHIIQDRLEEKALDGIVSEDDELPF